MNKKTVSGIIQITRKGVGYVAWPRSEAAVASKAEKEQEDIEIPIENLGGAFNGDVVEVELGGLAQTPFRKPRAGASKPAKSAGGRFTGKVVAVIERAKTEFVCTLAHQNNIWMGVADDTRMYKPFHIQNVPTGTKENTKALVKLVSFYGGAENPLGEILEVIGQAGEHRAEMNSIVIEHGFRTEFSKEIQEEAKKIEEEHAQTIQNEAHHRVDFRGVTTMTIDPLTAKDFDDALSIQEITEASAKTGGNTETEYEIGVHIADVTFFVRPGSAIEEEARKRGTSVYLVDATIPMLPEELSGNVCSLKEGEDRLAFSAVFRINTRGEVLARRFERTIICSQKRFTYEEAQEVLDIQKGQFLKELNTLNTLAKILRKAREQEGAIDFGDNEVKFVLDASGKPIGVERKVRIATNELIEEFMLLANREVAKHVSVLAQKVPEKNYVFLYRIHDEPKADRIEELSTFVRAIGYDFEKRGKKGYSARDIGQLLKQIEGKPEQHLIRTATLRSMAKAIYTTKNIGHFGLAFDYYTHFTSPIRRYPDMLVHRILNSHILGNPMTRREYDSLENLCIKASEQEAKAVSAERDSIRYKQVEYMQEKIGQTFEAVISGVTDWGLYVEDTVSACEGLVRVKSIGGDFYNHSQKEYSLVGERTKKKFTLGDKVNVKLVAADLIQRTLDFELV
ncbi:MAG: ribonuclease R [bacterium]